MCPPPKPCNVQFRYEPPSSAPTKLLILNLFFLAIFGINLCVVEASVHLNFASFPMDYHGFYRFSWVILDRQTNLMDLKKFQNVCHCWTPHIHLEESHSGMEFTTREAIMYNYLMPCSTIPLCHQYQCMLIKGTVCSY